MNWVPEIATRPPVRAGVSGTLRPAQPI